MAAVLTLDFETHDPNITLKKGAGWVYEDFEILGAAYKLDNEESQFTTDMSKLAQIVATVETIICHNSQYDIGCLHRLGIDYKDKTIVDTMILAKLYDNSMSSYSLDHLAHYCLGKRKDYESLQRLAEAHSIQKYMSHMRELFKASPEIVSSYAKLDVDLTYELSQYFKKNIYDQGLELVPIYSDLIKALVLSRSAGVRIDMNQAERSDAALDALYQKYLEEFYTYCPGVNIESTKQLAEAFMKLDIVPGVSAKGGFSVDAAWRATQDHPAIVALDNAKKYNKLRREFVEGLVTRVENGRLYPEMNIMGAAETGRFSSSNPNIQQIPKRSELAAELIRSLFIPEEGETWYSLDFSSQEPRFQVHYAYAAGCKGSEELRKSFVENPKHDLHQQVADMAGIGRTQAKTINLGISYGMGSEKLAKALKLSPEEAKALMNKYKKFAPYLYQLNKAVQQAGVDRGYVKTILGRRLVMDYDKPYKALNKLIQGSAADQTTMAIVQAYREGIPILFSVHDELNISTSDPKKAHRLKEIMETVLTLEVPCLSEMSAGSSWNTTSLSS